MKIQTASVLAAILWCIAGLMGCTDVSSSGPTPPEFNSEFRFLNAASELGDVSITLDLGPNISNIGFGAASSHQTYPSGNRVATLSNGDTLRIAMTSDQRATVVILPMTSETREFVKLVERRVFDPPTTSTGRLRLVHAGVAGSDAGASVDITVAGPDTVSISALAFRGDSGYFSLTPGSYTISAVETGGDGTVIATTSVEVGNARATSALTGDMSSLSFSNLTDN